MQARKSRLTAVEVGGLRWCVQVMIGAGVKQGSNGNGQWIGLKVGVGIKWNGRSGLGGFWVIRRWDGHAGGGGLWGGWWTAAAGVIWRDGEDGLGRRGQKQREQVRGVDSSGFRRKRGGNRVVVGRIRFGEFNWQNLDIKSKVLERESGLELEAGEKGRKWSGQSQEGRGRYGEGRREEFGWKEGVRGGLGIRLTRREAGPAPKRSPAARSAPPPPPPPPPPHPPRAPPPPPPPPRLTRREAGPAPKRPTF